MWTKILYNETEFKKIYRENEKAYTDYVAWCYKVGIPSKSFKEWYYD